MSTVQVGVKVKQQIAKRVAAGESRTAVAAEFGVSRRTLGRWIEEVSGDNTPVVTAAPKAKKQASKSVAVEPQVEAKQPEPVAVEPQEAVDVEYRVIATRRSISISQLVDGQVEGSVVIDNTQDVFAEVFDLIANSGLSQDALAKAFIMAQPKKMVESYTEGKLKVDVKRGVLTYTPDNGVPFEVSGLLSKRIIETIKQNGVDGAKTLINFFNKLMLNPSNRSVNELYGFLEHNDIELTAEGNFLAWKVVRSDYLDCHSGTMDNSVGTEVRVSRNQVDENSERTCSYGLHVCAKSYIKHFSDNSSRVVQVEVDPADVVAIPRDYNNAKMRCCGYKVLRDVTHTMK